MTAITGATALPGNPTVIAMIIVFSSRRDIVALRARVLRAKFPLFSVMNDGAP